MNIDLIETNTHKMLDVRWDIRLRSMYLKIWKILVFLYLHFLFFLDQHFFGLPKIKTRVT